MDVSPLNFLPILLTFKCEILIFSDNITALKPVMLESVDVMDKCGQLQIKLFYCQFVSRNIFKYLNNLVTLEFSG